MNIGDIVLYNSIKWKIAKFYSNRACIEEIDHNINNGNAQFDSLKRYVSRPRVTCAPLADIRLFPDYSVMM